MAEKASSVRRARTKVSPDPHQATENKKEVVSQKRRGSKVFMGILVLLLIITSLAAYYFYRNYTELKNNPNIQAQEETEILMQEVGALMQLPTDEVPTIATVLEKEKLQDQDFFKNAENGDKILAFMGIKKAILYRPSENKIIEVAPIFIEQDQALNEVSQDGTSPPTQSAVEPEQEEPSEEDPLPEEDTTTE